MDTDDRKDSSMRTIESPTCDALHEIGLEQASESRTRVTQRESFRGVLVPFLTGMLEPTRQGFDAIHAALAERVTSARRA